MKLIRWFLISLTIVFILLGIAMNFSGDGYAVAAFWIVGPFVALGVAVLWGLFYGLAALFKPLLPKRSDRQDIINPRAGAKKTSAMLMVSRVLSVIFILSLGVGAYLLIEFAAQGGPNKGSGFFHGYFAMQLGIVLVVFSTVGAMAMWVTQRQGDD